MTFPLLRGRSRPYLFAATLGAASLSAQEIVLERYYVTAPPPTGGPAQGVGSNTLRSQLPIDVAAQLARELPSVAPVRRGGVATDLLLRGLGRDDVTITLDGAPAYCACPGRMDPPAFHVSSPLVEHIAVHAGPFDVRAGGAPGGAIAVETAEPPAAFTTTGGAVFGEQELVSVDAAIGGALSDAWRGLLSGSYQQAHSYRDGDGRRITALPGLNYRPERRDALAFRIAHAEAHARWESQPGRELTFRAALNDASDVFYPALMMDAQFDRSSRLALGWRATSASPLVQRWRVNVYHHRVDHDMSDAFRTSSLGLWSTRGFMMRTIARATNYGANVEAETASSALEIVYGAQAAVRNWTASNTLGPNLNPMLPDVTVDQFAAYLQAERPAGAWKFRAGARADFWRSAAADDLTFVQRAHATGRNAQSDFAPSGFILAERSGRERTAVFAGLGHGARLPDPQERYISLDRPGTGTDWVGNPRLGVVRSTELTVGGRAQLGAMRIAVRAFHARLDNHILFGRLLPATGSTANPTRTESYFGIDAELTGAEIIAETALGRGWTFATGAAGQRGRKRSLIAGDTDRDLPEMPPWRGRAALRWERAETRFELEAQWAARQSKLDLSAGEKPVAGFGVLHARAEHALNARLTIAGGIDNLFDRTYATHNAYTRDPFAAGLVLTEPGRFAYVKLRWAH